MEVVFVPEWCQKGAKYVSENFVCGEEKGEANKQDKKCGRKSIVGDQTMVNNLFSLGYKFTNLVAVYRKYETQWAWAKNISGQRTAPTITTT